MAQQEAMKKDNLFNAIISILLVILLTHICFSCNRNDENKNNAAKKTAPGTQILLKPGSSFGDTLIIELSSAVFYNPDSFQLKKIKFVDKKMIFESITHDCFYQMKNARMVLKKYWPHVRIVETSHARYLQFIKNDKRKICIDLNTKNDICGIFLFDREKDPQLIDMMNIDTELGFYFKK